MVDFYFDVPDYIIENQDGNKVLIVLKKKDSKIENINLVENILKSINLSLENCQVEILEQKISLGKNMSSFEKVIAFGLSPAELGLNINFRPYAIHKITETKVLFSHSLTELLPNADYKKHLWQGIQLMFDLIKK